MYLQSQNTAVSVAMDYRVEGQCSNPGRGKMFLFSLSSRLALEHTQPPIHLVPGAVSLGVKQLKHEADHLPPSSSEVKNGGAVHLRHFTALN
jgi:hypothetical protein